MKNSNFAVHNFNGVQISQVSEDTVINGVLIPKGYCNATEMCKVNGKRWAKYLDYSKTQSFLNELVQIHQSLRRTDSYELVITIDSGSIENRGTWISHYVAMNLAQWLSSEFAAWAAITLLHVINNDFQALTPDALKAQESLKQIWLEVRTQGKRTRRSLTDAIKDWYERNPNGTSRPISAMIAQTTNLIYLALWGKTALEIEAIFECTRNQSRECMSTDCLSILDHAEFNVIGFIDDDNIKPVDAVPLANIRKSKVPLAKK